jgi:hypothetical protein
MAWVSITNETEIATALIIGPCRIQNLICDHPQAYPCVWRINPNELPAILKVWRQP